MNNEASAAPGPAGKAPIGSGKQGLPEELPSGGRRVHVVACGVLAVDLKALVERLGLDVQTTFLPGGLHNAPHELRERLQQTIDAISGAAEPPGLIAIGYGVCGRGAVGLHARGVPLAIPRVHDCIALFLGSDRAYREQFAKYPGTYYVSAGWVEEKVRPWSSQDKERPEPRSPVAHDFDELVRRYGLEHAEAIRDFLSSWHRNYQRAAFIDTGEATERRARYAGMAEAMSAEFGWLYEELPGTHDLLERLLTARESSDEILIVPPRHVTVYDAAQRRMRAAPVQGEAAQGPTMAVYDAEPGRPAAAQAPAARLGLGIDAGGTYTDAVLYDFEARAVLQKAKSLTTKWDYAIGINAALDQLDRGRFAEVDLVSVSTTLATNATVEGRGQKVGLLLMTPCGWPDPENFTHDLISVVEGQLDITGHELVPVNPAQIRRIVRDMLDRQGVKAFAVAGYASHVNPAHELQIKAAIRAETDAVVTCGHDVSAGLNYRVRAETAVLNARIIPALGAFLADVQASVRGRGMQAPVMVVKSDGSLMSLAAARERPIETLLSGPAASVAGAGYLTGAPDAIIVDIGGTTTDLATMRHGVVQTCEDGATVGPWKTHVEALDMRTLGLGGDSRICRRDGRLEIGPQRIAPVAWLARQHPRAGEALTWLEHNLDRFDVSTRGMELLALTPYAQGRSLEEGEQRIVQRLRQRPYSVEEMVEKEQCHAEQFLALGRLEEDHAVQRCGLTPTDLLHAAGRLQLWDAGAAQRMCDLYVRLMRTDRSRFIEQGLEQFVQRLAIELLKKQFAGEIDPDLFDQSPAAMALIHRALGRDAGGCSVRIALQTPVIGIGAPAHFFLPAAARLLQTEAIIPEHADVANALGAITSQVRIHRRVTIAVDEKGLYRVEGLPGTPTFGSVEEAQACAVERLQDIVRELGHRAGTGQSKVEVRIDDRLVDLKDGQQLFLERSVEARLTGRPDLVRLSVQG